MNKLLRNPWVVAGLVIGMAALWWVEMRTILYPGGTSSEEAVAVVATDVTPTLVSDDSSAQEPLVVEPLTPSRGPTQLRWDITPSRDPFGPALSATPVTAPVPEVAPTPTAVVDVEPVEVVPALEAVLNTPSAHMAVVDGRIVRVGDRINGRAVLRIDNASVALSGGPEAGEPLILKLPSR